MTNYLILFILSIIFSFIIIRLFMIFFNKYKILDNPEKYNLKRKAIPYSMGVVFFITFFIISFICTKIGIFDYSYKLGLIWVFGFLITGISFIDDMVEVSAKARLMFQIIIGAIIGITSIKIGYISNIFGGIINLETYNFVIFDYTIYVIPLIFTICWYVFIFNALNWTDGIGGNTSGITTISFIILFFLGMILFGRDTYDGSIQNAKLIMGITLILAAILIPFWYFDFNERILMGDSGTMFLGFMLATIAIIAGGKVATVLVVFGIYSVDAVYVILNRLYNKKNPLKGDFTHLHHRLLKIGLQRKQVLYLIYSLSFFFGLTALFLDRTGKIIVFAIIVVIVVFINKILESLLKKRKKKRD